MWYLTTFKDKLTIERDKNMKDVTNNFLETIEPIYTPGTINFVNYEILGENQ